MTPISTKVKQEVVEVLLNSDIAGDLG